MTLSTPCACSHVEVLHAIRANGSRGACSVSSGAQAVPCGCPKFTAAEPDDGGLFPVPDQTKQGGPLL